jgi:poly(3-hydroxybutyrate) depolymerase
MSRFVGAATVALLVIWASSHWQIRLRATILRDQFADVDGVKRRYRLVIPRSLSASRPAPLLFAFHGARGSADGMAKSTNLDRLAVDQGFFLVYLEGRHSSWPPFIPPENPRFIEPDLLFFDLLCDELIGRYNIDDKRVYATGMSQGAAFVNLLVAKRSDKIAAAAPHSGWLPKPLADEGIEAVRKCPLFMVAGTDDAQVPEEVVRRAAECFRNEGHPVELHLINGLGHRWASKHTINEKIWAFLASHRLSSTPDAGLR